MKQKEISRVAGGETYTLIDGRKVVQHKLVLGQLEMLIEHLQDVQWPDPQNFNLLTFYRAIGNRMPVVLAILLTGDGEDPRSKDIPALAEDYRHSMPVDEGIRAFKDFFSLNPTASIVGELREMMPGQKREETETGSQT